LVTRLLPRSSLKARVSTLGLTFSADKTFLASESTVAREINRCSVATYASPSCSARTSASASTRAKDPDKLGWLTDEPFAEGSLEMAPCAAAATTVGSAPAADSNGATVLPGVCSSAWSRWDGSAYGLPSVRAVRKAAETASRLLVVSLLVSMSPLWSNLSKPHSTMRQRNGLRNDKVERHRLNLWLIVAIPDLQRHKVPLGALGCRLWEAAVHHAQPDKTVAP